MGVTTTLLPSRMQKLRDAVSPFGHHKDSFYGWLFRCEGRAGSSFGQLRPQWRLGGEAEGVMENVRKTHVPELARAKL